MQSQSIVHCLMCARLFILVYLSIRKSTLCLLKAPLRPIFNFQYHLQNTDMGAWEVNCHHVPLTKILLNTQKRNIFETHHKILFFNRYPLLLFEVFQKILLKVNNFSLANSFLVVKKKPNKVVTLMMSYWRSPTHGFRKH